MLHDHATVIINSRVCICSDVVMHANCVTLPGKMRHMTTPQGRPFPTISRRPCVYAAALQHQDEDRSEVMAKMVEHAKKLESRAADRIQAALDQELGHATNGKNMHKRHSTHSSG